MADIDVTGTEGVLPLPSQNELKSTIYKNIDEDLIDYDSDDAFTKPDTTLAVDHTHAMDITDNSIDDNPTIDQDFTRAGASEEDGAAPKGDEGAIAGSDEAQVDALDYNAADNDVDRRDDGVAVTESKNLSPLNNHETFHEIDYEHDKFVPETAHQSDHDVPSAVADSAPGPETSDTHLAKSAVHETTTEHYEIDWEEDEGTGGQTAQESAETEGPEATSDAHAMAEAFEAAQETYDHDDEASESQGHVGTGEQGTPESAEFPAITVQYKGEEYPLFSHSTDGFFSDTAILDKSMKSVLDGLRTELADEIGPQDDLVLQVDKLGLEFSESSPRDALSAITLSQILELLDILVKNQDPDHSRELYTYLFTRPNVMKRFDFLVESATGDKTLADVMHLFQPQKNGPVTGYPDAFEEKLDSYESPGDDGTAQTSREYSNDNAVSDEALEDDTYVGKPDAYDDEGPPDSSNATNGDSDVEAAGDSLKGADEESSPDQEYNQDDDECAGGSAGKADDEDEDPFDPLSWDVERGPVPQAEDVDEILGAQLGGEDDLGEALDTLFDREKDLEAALDHQSHALKDRVDEDPYEAASELEHADDSDAAGKHIEDFVLSGDDLVGIGIEGESLSLGNEVDEDLIEYESMGEENGVAEGKADTILNTGIQFEEAASTAHHIEHDSTRVDQSDGVEIISGEDAVLGDIQEIQKSIGRESSPSSHTEAAPDALSELDLDVASTHVDEGPTRTSAINEAPVGYSKADVAAGSGNLAVLHQGNVVDTGPENLGTRNEMSAYHDDAAEIDWLDDMPSGAATEETGSAAGVQPHSMKRAVPGEFDGEDGNDVKRRRS
ncbi:hypothetical protein HIM_04467 [Hirsutella minnesotensis 3608]|uniref:Uncharacterized protein n=1 Tax=Hirsutella minnesotensis 3608 TaxID=1043627 RepID=A0A0F7ZL54_9HYPO|nr:hypothetical protein HIM_04467 [Hirsutella minnesotensis 3608]